MKIRKSKAEGVIEEIKEIMVEEQDHLDEY